MIELFSYSDIVEELFYDLFDIFSLLKNDDEVMLFNTENDDLFFIGEVEYFIVSLFEYGKFNMDVIG